MIRPLLAALLLIPLGGCISLSTDDFTAALLDHDDPETVAQAMPTFLLLADGIIHDDPDDEDKLMGGARLYSNYSVVFVQDPERLKRLTARARSYAETAMCEYRKAFCGLAGLPFDRFERHVGLATRKHVPFLHAYAVTWAIWIQARGDDWSAIADLPRVKAIMKRVVVLDERYDRGSAHLYLGIIESLLPPALGGKPGLAREHFERALALSDGKDLSVKVEFARRYARQTFDRSLHDRLLNEVLGADARAPGLTLSNTLAKREAERLLKSADKYF